VADNRWLRGDGERVSHQTADSAVHPAEHVA
jgi:hypothetical protein